MYPSALETGPSLPHASQRSALVHVWLELLRLLWHLVLRRLLGGAQDSRTWDDDHKVLPVTSLVRCKVTQLAWQRFVVLAAPVERALSFLDMLSSLLLGPIQDFSYATELGPSIMCTPINNFTGILVEVGVTRSPTTLGCDLALAWTNHSLHGVASSLLHMWPCPGKSALHCPGDRTASTTNPIVCAVNGGPLAPSTRVPSILLARGVQPYSCGASVQQAPCFMQPRQRRERQYIVVGR
eukprot:scaffold4372_cov397-Prasinococcus_capsulatus_cf.AAC.31